MQGWHAQAARRRLLFATTTFLALASPAISMRAFTAIGMYVLPNMEKQLPSTESQPIWAAYLIRLTELTLPMWTCQPCRLASCTRSAAALDSFHSVVPPRKKQLMKPQCQTRSQSKRPSYIPSWATKAIGKADQSRSARSMPT